MPSEDPYSSPKSKVLSNETNRRVPVFVRIALAAALLQILWAVLFMPTLFELTRIGVVNVPRALALLAASSLLAVGATLLWRRKRSAQGLLGLAFLLALVASLQLILPFTIMLTLVAGLASIASMVHFRNNTSPP